MDDQMNLDTRLQLLESAVARLHREMHELQTAIKGMRPGAAMPGQSTLSGGTAPALPKYAAQWLLAFDDRGIPRARPAMQHECRQPGGGGKGDWCGDPEIRKDPPRWKGESFASRRMSMATPEYLRAYADFEEWKGMKTLEDADPEKRKFVTYNLRNAALAKGWAEILSNPSHRPGAELDDGGFGPSDADEDIPF